MNTTEVTITGLTPLLMHSSRLADPLDPAAKELSKLTTKKKKSDADHLAVRECEWRGGLYLDEKGRPCLPGEVIEACLTSGAKRLRMGNEAKSGLIVDGNFAIEYDGPKTVKALWEHGGYKKLASVKVKQSRVIRTRPMFSKWSCAFVIDWDPLVIKDESTLFDIAKAAGQCGIGDWRPKYGRFEVS